MEILVGDTLYFSASDGSTGYELWAHDTSNSSTWKVSTIGTGTTTTSGSNPGTNMAILVGDIIYFDADDWPGSNRHELWAHDTSNGTTWQVYDTALQSFSNRKRRMRAVLERSQFMQKGPNRACHQSCGIGCFKNGVSLLGN